MNILQLYFFHKVSLKYHTIVTKIITEVPDAVPCLPCFSMLFEVMTMRSYNASHAV